MPEGRSRLRVEETNSGEVPRSEGASQRAAPDPQIGADSELAAEGWKLRFVASGERLQEAVDLYTELGYEVRLLPAQPATWNEECEGCRLAELLEFEAIYTRKLRRREE